MTHQKWSIKFLHGLVIYEINDTLYHDKKKKKTIHHTKSEHIIVELIGLSHASPLAKWVY